MYYVSIVLLFTNECRKNMTSITGAIINNLWWVLLQRCESRSTTRTAAPSELQLLSPVEHQQHKKQRSKKKGKRNTFSRKDPDKDLPTCRFEPGEHKRTWLKTTDNQKNRAWCEWCKYEAAVAKQDGNPLPRKTPVKTTKFCTSCGPYYRLCPDHFDIWHEQS